MKVLIINLDKAVFSPISPNRERLFDYAGLVEKLSVIVWTLKKEEPICERNLEIYPTNSISKVFYFCDAFKIAKKIIKEQGIDLIVCQDPFETGFAGWRLAKKFKIPLQLQVHTDFLNPFYRRESVKNRGRAALAKYLLTKADGIRVVSQRIRDSFLGAGLKAAAPLVVLPIFSDLAKLSLLPVFDLKRKYAQFDAIVLSVARLSREKNLGLAIAAMAEVVKKFPKTGYLIVGAGPEEKNLKRLAVDKGLENKVFFEGRVSPDRLASYYKGADVFLLTSNYEGWGLAAIEAMACALPPVMTDAGCAGEVIKNNKNGFVVPVGAKEKIVEAVSRLLADGNFARQIRIEAEKTAGNLMSKDEYLKQLKSSWEKAIENHSKAL